MSYDTGFSRRSGSERDLQPAAIVAVDPTTRTATAVTRTRHTIYINCAYATGDTITTPAVGEQWYCERFGGEWRLYGRIPFNDATLNIAPEEGQVSVGSAYGPLELNGTEVHLNGDTVRINGVYYRDNGETLQRSEDKITWETVLSAIEGNGTSIQLISEALTNFTGTDQDAALEALKQWSETVQTLVEQSPDAWGEISQNAFIDGLRRMGTGTSDISKMVDGTQNFIDYLFGTLFCDFDGNLTPQTILARTRDLATPISKRPIIQRFVNKAEQAYATDPTHTNDTFLEKIFYGFELLFDGPGGNTNTTRRRWANLLLDPGAEFKELWEQQSDVVWVSTVTAPANTANPNDPWPNDQPRHGQGQLMMTAGSTDKRFWWTIDDVGEPEWIDTKEGEIYQAECYVRAPRRNVGTGLEENVHIIIQFRNSQTQAVSGYKYVPKAILQQDGWHPNTNRISGHVTVPGPNMLRERYRTTNGDEWDQIRFGFELIASQTTDGDIFFIDDMSVKEMTGIQRILKGIHEPIFGDSIEYPTYEDMQKGVLRLLRRRTGPNLIADPHIQHEEFWTGISSVQYITKGIENFNGQAIINHARSGRHSLRVISGGATPVKFDWMRDENSEVSPILTEANDIFYVECWVYGLADNAALSTITIHGTAVDTSTGTTNATTGVTTYSRTVEITPIITGVVKDGGLGWTQINGYYAIPEPDQTEGNEAIFDGFLCGITLKAGDTVQGDIFYVDDLEVREVSDSQALSNAIQIGLFGNNGRLNRPEFVERGMRNLARLSRAQKRMGPNLLVDPGAEFPEFWEPQSDDIGISGENEASRSGVRSFKMISGGGTEKTFWWTIDDLGEIVPITTQTKEVFYIECHVLALRGPQLANLGNNNVRLIAQVTKSNDPTKSRSLYVPFTVTNRNAWIEANKIHARFTVPGPDYPEDSPYYDETAYDRVKFGFQLPSGGSVLNDIFFIDDLVVHEITGVQRTLKSIHEPIFGDNMEYPTYEDVYKGIRGLFNFLRKRAWAGTNLVTDSKIENDNDWWVRTGDDVIPGLAVVERTLVNPYPVRSRKQSLRLTSAGPTARSFDILRDDLGAPQPVITQGEDVFYVEVWVYSPGPLDFGTANNATATITLYGNAIDSGALDTDANKIFELVGAESNPAPLVNPARGVWHKISGYFTIPVPTVNNNYDGFQVGIELKANQTESGDVFYFDDLLVREVTEAQIIDRKVTKLKRARKNRDAAAPNLLVDPSAELPELWIPQASQVTWVSDEQRSGTGALLVTSAGITAKTFWWTLDEDGELNPIITQEGEVFYAECYVLAPSGQDGNQGPGAVTLVVEASNSQTGLTTEYFVPDTVTKSNLWLKGNLVSGNFTVPGPNYPTTSPHYSVNVYDRLRFGFRLVANATTTGDRFYVDDMVVKEITGLQRTWNSIHQAVFGDSDTDKTFDEAAKGLKGLALLLRGRNAAGTNLVPDPKIDNTDYWSGSTGLAVVTSPRRSRTQSLELTSGGTTPRSFDWMRTDTGAARPIVTQPNDAFYVECWVYSPLSNNSAATITIHGTVTDTANDYSTTLTPITKVNPTRTNWVKISGYFAVPDTTTVTINSVATEINYDNLQVGITLGAGATSPDNKFYFDDLLIREVTLAQATVDSIHQGIFGGNSRFNSTTGVRTGILGLANLGRGRAGAGSNLVNDPKIKKAEFWSGTDGLTVVTQPRRSLTQSLQLTSQGSTAERRFDWTVDDTGAVSPIVTSPGDVFYVECYVYSDSANSNIATVTLHGHVVDMENPSARTSITPKLTQVNPSPGGGWVKLSGFYTIPTPVEVGGVTPTYDGFIAGITLEQGATTLNNKFYVDDLIIREVTVAQNAIDDFHRGLFGGFGKYRNSDEVRAGLFGLASLGRNRNKAGSNLVTDPKIDTSEFWSGITGLTVVSSPRRSASQALALTSAGATARSFDWTRTDTATVTSIATQENDIFYVECHVYSPTGNATGTITLHGRAVASNTGATTALSPTITKQITGSNSWVKISGYYTIPAPTVVDANTTNIWDGFQAGITLAANNTTSGNVFYFDDLVIREITVAQRGLDKLHQGLFGGSGQYVDPEDVRKGILGLALLGRGRNKSGSNILVDPKVESAELWAGITGLTVASGFGVPRRSGSQSLEITSAGTTGVSFDWMRTDTGTSTPIVAQEGDTFYVECWVQAASANGSDVGTVTLFGTAKNSIKGTSTSLTASSMTLTNPTRGQWRKISGTYTIPVDTTVTDSSSSNDQFVVGITVTSPTATTYKFYIDDMVVREITAATAAASLADRVTELARRKQKSGANLVLDPKIEMPSSTSYWMKTGNTALAIYIYSSGTSYKRTGAQSLAVTIPAGGTSLALTLDDTGATTPLMVQNDDVFYAEVWIRTSTSATVTLRGKWANSANVTSTQNLESYSKSLVAADNWFKLSGSFTIPDAANAGTGTYDSLIVELAVSGTTNNILYVDDILVRENTLAQNVIDNLHQGILGGSNKLNNPGTVKTALANLAGLGRRRNKAGSNLLADPKVEGTDFWPTYATANSLSSVLSINTAVSGAIRSGTQSLAVTIPAGGTTSFWWNIDDQGAVAPLVAQNNDVFYAECWVYSAATGITVTLNGKWVKSSNITTPTPQNLTVSAGSVTSLSLPIGWTKLSGTFTVDSTGSTYDAVLFGLTVAGTAAQVLYVDDMLVREITAAQGASTTAAGASLIAQNATNAARRRQRAGANLVLDPKVEITTASSYWLLTGNTALSINTNTTYRRSNSQSLAVTIPAGGTAFVLTIDDTGATVPLACQSDDVFYAEVWIKTATSGTVTLNGKWANSSNVGSFRSLATYSRALTSADGWYKLSGSFTIPDSTDVDTGTYDSLVVELSIIGTTNNVIYVDDLLVRENTLAQNVIDNLQQGILGGSNKLNSAGSVKTAIGNLAGLGRSQQRAGSNLLADPKVTNPALWNAIGNTALTVVNDSNYARSGTQALMITAPSPGGTAVSFDWTIDDQGVTAPVAAQEGDIFYVECWVYSPAGNGNSTFTLYAKWAKTDAPATNTALTLTAPVGGVTTVGNPSGWTKLSGMLTIDAGTVYDGLIVGITATGATAGNKLYVDSLLVRENTVGQNAVDKIHQALTGNTGSKYNDPEKVRTGILGLATMSRSRNKAGSNLIVDPKIEAGVLWTNIGNAALTINTTAAFTRSGTGQSLKVTAPSPGGTAVTFDLTINDQGVTAPIATQDDDYLYAEAWVLSPSGNGSVTVTLTGKQVNDTASAVLTTYSQTIATGGGGWVKVGGYFNPTGTTYTGMVFTLTVTGATANNAFYVDDLMVRETTLAQKAIDNLQQGIFGGSAKYNDPTSVKTGILGLANLNRGRTAAGSNLLADPKIRYADFWAGVTGLAVVSGLGVPKRSITQSLELTSAGATERYFNWTVDDTATLTPIVTQEGDIFYAECWVNSPTGNGAATVTIFGQAKNSSTGTVTALTDIQQSVPATGVWTKISGQFTIPASGLADSSNDQFIVGVALRANQSTSGKKFYIDDLVVREITVAQKADTSATEAKAGTQTFRDKIHQAISGNAGDSNKTDEDVRKGLLKALQSGRSRQQAGSNLVPDPKIAVVNTEASPWNAYAAANSATVKLAVETTLANARSGIQSLRATAPTTFCMVFDDLGTITPVAAQNSDVFYVECWVKGTGTASLTGLWVKSGTPGTGDTITPVAPTNGVTTVTNPSGWQKIAAYFTIPSTASASNYDSFEPRLTLASGMYADDLAVREVTEGQAASTSATEAKAGTQTFRDKIHQAISGNTGDANKTDEEVRQGLNKVFQLGRNRQRAGSNLVNDPKIVESSSSSSWAAYAAKSSLPLAIVTTPRRSGIQSLQTTSATTFSMTINDLGVVTPLAAQNSDIFYVEAWVAGTGTVTLSALWVKSDTPDTGSALTGVAPTGGSLSATPTSNTDWRKISGYFTIPATALNDYDSFNARITTTTGTLYVDDMAVREVTEAQAAAGTAKAAKDGNQTFINRIHDALNGGTTGTDRTPDEVKGLFQKLNQSLFRNDALPASAASATVSYYAVPDLDRAKIPHLQNVIDNIHQSMFGGSATGNDPSVVKTGLLGLANLSRGRNAAGSNLLGDPKINYSNFWTGVTGLALSSSTRRSWTQSLELTSAGATARSFYWTVDDTATVQPIIAQEGDIFFVECWIFSPLANISTATITVFGQAKNSATGTVTDLNPLTLVDPVRAGWRKISGYFTIPVSGLTDSSNDQFFVGALLGANATTSGNKFYFDDLVVREVTVAQNANTGNQDTIDNIYQGVFGGTNTGNNAGGLKTLFQNLNQSLFRSNNYPGASGQVAYASVPDLDRAKIPHLQNVIDNVHQSMFGGSATGNDPSVVKTGLLGLANLGRGRSKAGSNLLPDPKITYSNFWSGVTGLALSSSVRRSLSQSLELTSAGATERSFYWTVDDTAALTPIVAQETDIFYVECWVYSLAGNAATATITIFGQAKNSTTGTVTGLTPLTAVNPTRGVWTKISGYFTIPTSGLTDSSNDQFIVGASLTANATTSGNKFYFDDLVVREVTVAKGAADTASGAASTAAGAVTGNQDTLDFIYQGVAGGSSTGNTRAGLKGLLQNLNQSLFRSNNYPGASGTVAYAAVPALDRGKVQDLQDTIDGVQQAMFGGSATGNIPSTVKTGLLGLANLSRGRGQAGSNLVSDPKINYSGFWPVGTNGLAVSSVTRRSLTQSLELTSVGTTGTGNMPRYFDWTRNDTAAVVPLVAAPGDIFYVECWVRAGQVNTGTITLHGYGLDLGTATMVTPTTLTEFNTRTAALATFPTLASPSNTAWTKLSGTFTVPANCDGFVAGITLVNGATTSGHTFYFDDLVIREITVAKGAADSAQNAIDGNQSTINNIHQAFSGDGTTGSAGGLKTFFQNLHKSLYDQTSFPGLNSQIAYKTVPELDRAKIPQLKTTIDNIHNAITGGSGTNVAPEDLGTVFPRLVGLNRNRQRAGSNLVNDPKIAEPSASSSWSAYAAKKPVPLSIVTTPRRSGIQSLQVTGAATFSVTINDLGDVFPVTAQNSDIFYVEAWVAGTATATLSGLWVKSSVPDTGATPVTAAPTNGTLSATPTSTSDWRKISGYFTIPATASSDYDSFNALITTTGTIYVDDIAVREVTAAEAARGTADAANTKGQGIINRLHEALNGGTASTDKTPEEVRGLFQNLNQALFRNNALPATPASATIAYNSVPELDRLKIPHLQNVIDNIQQSMFGGSATGNDPSTVKTGLLGLANLSRGRNAAGSNLVGDPKLNYASFWSNITAYPGMAIVSSPRRSLTQSLELTATTLARQFDFTFSDTGTLTPIITQPGDIFYVECWVQPWSSNPSATATITLHGYTGDLSNSLVPSLTATPNANRVVTTTAAGFPTLVNPTRGTWTKISGYFTIPAGTPNDAFIAGITVPGFASGTYKFYLDDLVIREVTEAQAAAGSATEAKNGNQSVIDNIHQAFNGSGSGTAGGLKTWFQNLNSSLYDQSTFPGSAATVADRAIPPLGRAKIQDLKDVIDNVHNAITGEMGTNNSPSVLSTSLPRLVNLGRNRQRAGSNIILDPKIVNVSGSSHWSLTGNTALAVSTTYERSGDQSLALTTISANTEVSFAFTLDDRGSVAPITAQGGDIFYVECYVLVPVANVTSVALYGNHVRANTPATAPTTITAAAGTTTSLSSPAASTSNWVKLSGYYTIPARTTSPSNVLYDAFTAGITMTGTTASTSRIYVDDIIVREVTEAQAAAGTGQSIIDNIHQAFNGSGSGTTGGLKTWFQNLNSSLYRQPTFPGSAATVSQDAIPGDIPRSKIPNLKTVIDGVQNAVFGGTAVDNDPSTVYTGIFGLTNLGRGRNQAGSNLITDPKVGYSSFWSTLTGSGVVVSTAYSNSTPQSLQITSAGATERSFDWTRNDQSALQPIVATPGDVFQCECYLYYLPVASSSVGVANLHGAAINLATGARLTLTPDEITGDDTNPTTNLTYNGVLPAALVSGIGTYTLTWNGDTTSTLAWNASSATIKSALGVSALTVTDTTTVSGTARYTLVLGLEASSPTLVATTSNGPVATVARTSGGTAATRFTGATYGQNSLATLLNAATYSNMNDSSAVVTTTLATATGSGTGEWIRADIQASNWISHIILGYDYQNALFNYTRFATTTYTQSSLYSAAGLVAANYTNMNDGSAVGSVTLATGTNNEIDAFIRADVGSSSFISHIVIGYDYLNSMPGGWAPSYTEGLAVQGSTNGTSWTTITTTPTYASTGSTNGLVTISINGTYRYIRLYKASGYVATLEFQVWTRTAIGVAATEGLNIQGSTDNTNWTTITTSPTYASSGSSNGLVTIPINGSWRYLRLQRASGQVAATEFGVFGGTATYTLALDPPASYRNTWTKISARYTIPSGYDAFTAGITLKANESVTGDRFYVDDMLVREITLAQNTVDNVTNAFTGGETSSRRTLDEALAAMLETRRTLAQHTTQIQELQTAKTGGEVKGNTFDIDFSNYQSGELATVGSADWEVYYPSGAGTTNKIVVSGGLACWNAIQNADRDARIISKKPTTTNFQIMRGTMSVPPQTASGGGTPKFHAIGRVIGTTGDGTSYVWARAYANSLFSYRGEIGYTLNGVERVWATDIPLSWSLDMTFKVGNGTNARQYQVYSGSDLVKEWDENYVNGVSGTVNTSRSLMDGDFLVTVGAASGGTFTLTYTPAPVSGVAQSPAITAPIAYSATPAQVANALTALGLGTFYANSNGTAGPWYINPPNSKDTLTGTGSLTGGSLSVTKQSALRWGSVAQLRSGSSGPRHSGKLGGATAADNQTPTVRGSTARMHSTNSAALNPFGTGENTLPSGFFDTVDYESLDIDAVTSSGTFKVTSDGTYHITVRIEMNTTLSQWCAPVLQVSTDNGNNYTTVQFGNSVIPSQAGIGLSGDWIQYLEAGNMVRIRAYRNSGSTNETFGSTGGDSKNYFSITAIGGLT